ncbi:MAG: HAD-IA family hydrolase [Anaerolineae bacterium]|nr:HAD-IA family hydrolase [Anaerolineae bacterium]
MIKAVLLDMDDTLLLTDTDLYVRRYMGLLSQEAAQQFPDLKLTAQQIALAVRDSVRGSVANFDPTRSNLDIQGEIFHELTGIDAQTWYRFVDNFHQESHESLREIVRPIPNARPLIERLRQMGLAVVIATNPIFTRSAIYRRLAWAGVDDLDFAFVSSSENVHFTKPNAQFYEEILARVGVEADEAIMVGDGIGNDIIPARQVGMNTFWIDLGLPTDGTTVPSDAAGSLADFEAYVAAGSLNRLQPLPRTSEQLHARLMGNVGAIFGLADTMKPQFWNMRPDPNEWSPLEIAYHLRESERTVQRPRLQRIAAEDNPFISPPRTPFAPASLDLSGEDGYAILQEFWNERCKTLNFIYELPTEAWTRPARHSVFGPTTLLEMAHFTARHDHLHITQFCQTIGRCNET